MTDATTSLESKRDNNFGFLRIIFSTLVIVSHSSGLIDGNVSREFLAQTFGTLTFGEVAVDGFFIISGYLIVKSFVESASIPVYLFKRLLRIVPGYVVCFWICVFVVAPLFGSDEKIFSIHGIFHNCLRILRLMEPDVPGAFSGLQYPVLNGSM